MEATARHGNQLLVSVMYGRQRVLVLLLVRYVMMLGPIRAVMWRSADTGGQITTGTTVVVDRCRGAANVVQIVLMQQTVLCIGRRQPAMLLVVVFVVVPLLLAVLLEFALSGVEAATGAAATEELTGEETIPYADGTVVAAADPATMNGDAAAGDGLVITDTFINDLLLLLDGAAAATIATGERVMVMLIDRYDRNANDRVPVQRGDCLRRAGPVLVQMLGGRTTVGRTRRRRIGRVSGRTDAAARALLRRR
uniref:Uncharacterized protein n=1 Tax=Anopheles coluzzii TaxID=1518534 RepID=A0A8W7Q3N4_ANOCL